MYVKRNAIDQSASCALIHSFFFFFFQCFLFRIDFLFVIIINYKKMYITKISRIRSLSIYYREIYLQSILILYHFHIRKKRNSSSLFQNQSLSREVYCEHFLFFSEHHGLCLLFWQKTTEQIWRMRIISRNNGYFMTHMRIP